MDGCASSPVSTIPPSRGDRVHLLTEVKRARWKETGKKLSPKNSAKTLVPLPISPAADPNPRSQARDPGARGDGRRRRRGGGAQGAGDGALRPPDPRLGRRRPEEVRRRTRTHLFLLSAYIIYIPAPCLCSTVGFALFCLIF